MAEDVFERDDGVVDDHADGEAHSGQADDIDIATQKRHREEGADDGDRDGGGNDRDGADAAQEDEEDQDGERAADEDIGADQADGALEIPAHAHRQTVQAIALGYFAQQGEMQARFLIHRGDAHQALYRQIERARLRHEVIRIGGQNACFLRLFAGIEQQLGFVGVATNIPMHNFIWLPANTSSYKKVLKFTRRVLEMGLLKPDQWLMQELEKTL